MQITENTKVYQSNFLIENRPALTKDETRLFLTIIAVINKEGDADNIFKVPVGDFAALWGVDTKNAYQQIRTAVRSLRKKEFFIERENQITGKRKFLTAGALSAGEYEEGEGYAIIEVSNLFKPYLIGLKEKYTSYILKNIMNLNTVSAIRTYEILKQYQTIGKRKMTLSEYKRMLQIEEKYSRNIDLKRYVLEPAVKEIIDNTDIDVTYEYGGKKDETYVVFTIERKKQQTAPPQQEAMPESQNSDVADSDDQQYYNEIEQFRECLTDPSALSHEQLDVCVVMAQTSLWFRSLPEDLPDEQKTAALKNYIRQQDKHSRVNAKESFYGYLRKSCQNNWAGATWEEQKKEHEGTFDTDDFFNAALARSGLSLK